MNLFTRSNPIVHDSDERLVTGTAEDRQRARAELVHNKRVQQAMRSGLPELERGNLIFERHGYVVHDGAIYRVRRGEIDDPQHSGAVAYYFGASGLPVYLEPPTTGPRTVAERHQEQVAREQQRERREADAAARRRVWARAAS